MYEQILYEVDDPAATITLNRPHRLNAWTQQMAAEVRHAIARAEEDEKVVAIVITGAGRGFCSGADLSDLKAIGEGRKMQGGKADLEADPGDAEMGESFRGTYTYLLSVRKPIIAAINGAVAGMALPISLCCDLRFASDAASFTSAFARRGLIAEWGSSWLLPRVVGPSQALDILFSSRKIGADEAARLGLVNRVVPHDQLLAFVREYVRDLAANCSPASMRTIKRQIYQNLTATLGEAEKEAFQLMLETFNAPDFREGVNAFLEKRPPKFSRL